MSKTKSTVLRGFEIKNNSKMTKNFNLLESLRSKMASTAAKERWLKLSQSDKDVELISYTKSDSHGLFGIMLRMSLTSETVHISDELFENNIFTLDEMSTLSTEFEKMYLSHYYFYLNESKLVVNIPRGTGIRRFETYINWILESELNPYEFSPAVKNTKEVRMSDIKEIKFGGDSPISYNPSSQNSKENDVDSKKIDLFSMDLIKNLVSSVGTLKEEDLKQIISATLNIKFKKPRKTSEEEYAKTFSAILKPVTELEDVTFITKDNKTINSASVLCEETVKVELTNNGHLVDEQVRQSMMGFIGKL